MQDIKFRVYDTFIQSMAEGEGLSVSIRNGQVVSVAYETRTKHSRSQWMSHSLDANALDTERYKLMQFTGVLDKNGQEIFEGDVLQFSDKWEWYRCSFGWRATATQTEYEQVLNDHVQYPYERRVITIPCAYEWLLSSEIQTYWEVIGNIWQNPELAEEVK